MNQEIMQTRWNQLRNEAQLRWNKLGAEDLRSTRDQVDRLVQQTGTSVAEIQKAAGTRLSTGRQFLADNPWAAVVAAVLILGLVVGVFVRPNMRNY